MSQVRRIALWEFRRWYKVKDQLNTIGVSFLVALAIGLGARFFRDDEGPLRVALLGAPAPGAVTLGRFALQPSALPRDELLAEPTGEEHAAVLELLAPERALLHCDEPPDWVAELEEALAEEHRERRLNELALSPAQRERLFAPFVLEVVSREGDDEAVSAPAVWTALAVVGFAVLAVFVGMSYQFVAITGEKQARVTEVMLSAVTPEAWMDGKILGLSLLSVACLGTYLASSAAFLVTARLVGLEIPLALEFAASADLLWILLIALGGFLFWNTFFAAIAATINDPYSSTRGSLLMLPLFSLLPGGFALAGPAEPWVRFCAVFPPTAWTVLPVRLVLGVAPVWEILLALALLYGSVLLLRRAAGRIFQAAILMYGKEPSWREMATWVRRGGPQSR